jgi:hypothetical protein
MAPDVRVDLSGRAEFDRRVASTLARLTDEFRAALPPAVIERATRDTLSQLWRQARVKDFVPIFAYRDARARLSRLVRA